MQHDPQDPAITYSGHFDYSYDEREDEDEDESE
jgi:hypothetical protein